MKKLFKKVWKFQETIIYWYNKFHFKRPNSNKSFLILFGITLTVTFMAILFEVFQIDVISILGIFFLVSYFLFAFFKMLTSLTYFFIFGVICNSFACYCFIKYSYIFSITSRVPTLTFTVFFFIIWNLISILANSTVATTANSIVAGLTALITLVGNTIILILMPGSYASMPGETTIVLGVQVTYTIQQQYQIQFNFATMPLIITTGTAAMLCSVKKYWVEKYNDGKEISWKDFEAENEKDSK